MATLVLRAAGTAIGAVGGGLVKTRVKTRAKTVRPADWAVAGSGAP